MATDPTILLVDDEESIQKLLTYPLEREGYRVVQARDGEEALLQFAAQEVDLVVLDVMLPKLDGLEVCRRLRTTSAVPIIMLTARDDEVDKVLGLELGADDYITKPFSIREFRSRIRAVLRRATQLSDAAGGRAADRAGRAGDRPGQAHRAARRPAGGAHLRRVRGAAHAGRPTAAGSTAARRCWRRCGAARRTASRARSTCTSGTCARSSSSDPADPRLILTVRGAGYCFRDG